MTIPNSLYGYGTKTIIPETELTGAVIGIGNPEDGPINTTLNVVTELTGDITGSGNPEAGPITTQLNVDTTLSGAVSGTGNPRNGAINTTFNIPTQLTGAITGSGNPASGPINTSLNLNTTLTGDISGSGNPQNGAISTQLNVYTQLTGAISAYGNPRNGAINTSINFNLQEIPVTTSNINLYNSANPNQSMTVPKLFVRDAIDVQGSDVYTYSYGWFNSEGNSGTATDTEQYSIRCAYRVLATEFNAYSSINKKDILETPNQYEAELKEKYAKINWYKYRFKDPMKEGAGEFYGVISEEVAKIFPELVDKNVEDYTPNIKQYCPVEFIDSKTIKVILEQSLSDNIVGKHVVLNDLENSTSYTAIVKEKINDLEYIVDNLSASITPFPEKLYIYGTKEPCPPLAYTRFLMMTAATANLYFKEINERFQKLESTIDNLKQRLNTIKIRA